MRLRFRLATFWFLLLLVGSSAQLGAQKADVAPSIHPYLSCHFADGLQIVKLDPLPTTPMVRSVMTAHGAKKIVMEQGERIMFAYPLSDFYANVKVEELPSATYAEEKQALLDELTWLDKTDGHTQSRSFVLQGFSIAGTDKAALTGGVIGTYLLADDAAHVVTTIYFLNQEPQQNFHSMAEYQQLRDHFLAGYTSCVRLNQSLVR